MYALIVKTPDEAHCLAVSEHQTPLEERLKKEAKNFLDLRMSEEEQEELGYTSSLAGATTSWSDEDEEYPYELYIEETDWI
jgi:hypothetical protein